MAGRRNLRFGASSPAWLSLGKLRDRSLVAFLANRYYDGDPFIGEKPGIEMTPTERKASGRDRSRMERQPRAESNAEGGKVKKYSRDQKKKRGL